MRTNYKISDLPAKAQKHSRIFRLHRFIDATSVGMFGVILILLFQDRGFSLFDISVLLAVYFSTTLALELPLGGLADGIGRKTVFMMSVVAFIVSVVVLIWANNYWLTMLSMVLMGLRTALMSGTLVAWFVERFKILAPEFGTQPVLAKNKFAGDMGIGISSIAGGLIADFVGKSFAPYGFSKYEVPLLVSLVLGVVILVYTHFLIQEAGRNFNRKALLKGVANLGAIIRDSGQYGFNNKIISTMLLASISTAIAIFTFQNFWVPFVKPMLGVDYATSIIGILTFTYFTGQAVGTAIATPAIRFFNNNTSKALAYLVIACAVSLFAISLTSNIYAFIALLIVYTLFVGSVYSPFNSIYHDNIPNDKRSTLLSLASVMNKLGGLVGLLFIGFIADVYGIAIAWKVGSIFLFVASVLYFTLPKHPNNISNH